MNKKEIIISPSILAADFANLEYDIKRVENFVPWIHLDIMDGHFVPNISFGVPVVKSLRSKTKLFFDTHLMIENPQDYIDKFISVGSDLITFHYEATKENTINVIEQIKNQNKMVGLSIKPKTSVEEIKEYINLVDLILIMTVEPGFGGQKFMEDCAYKIKEVKEYSNDENLIIQIDGGINAETGKFCANLGANSLVAGSYIYNSENVEDKINSLKF